MAAEGGVKILIQLVTIHAVEGTANQLTVTPFSGKPPEGEFEYKLQTEAEASVPQ